MRIWPAWQPSWQGTCVGEISYTGWSNRVLAQRCIRGRRPCANAVWRLCATGLGTAQGALRRVSDQIGSRLAMPIAHRRSVSL